MSRSLVVALLCTSVSMTFCQPDPVDFRYSPARYFAVTCFPNDHLKTVVTERHGLGYDFGPGPYAVPLTEVIVRVSGDSLRLIEQHCADPVVPVFSASFEGQGVRVIQEAFSLPLGKRGLGNARKPAVGRTLGWNGTIGWVHPDREMDPAFTNTAWGVNRPILYTVPVQKGSEKLVALGVCEPYKRGEGQRVLDLRVEGAEPLIFDPLKAGKRNEPHVLFFKGRDVDSDGKLNIESHAAMVSPDPNPILNAFWIFPPDAHPAESDIISGRASGDAEMVFRCGLVEEGWPGGLRADMLISEFRGTSVTPEIIVSSGRSLEYDSSTSSLDWGGKPFVLSRPRAERCFRDAAGWHLVLPRGTARAEVFVLNGPWTKQGTMSLPSAEKARESTLKFWKRDVRLPHGRIQVPDSGIQYLLESSIRNLYQNGEIVDGGLEFHPGPSVYRGLWVHDAIWHISALLYLGDAMSAKLALDRILHFQLPSGQVRVMAPYVMNRETPMTVYAMVRAARLANDREWLLGRWEKLERALGWTEQRRKETLADQASPGYGLFPPGFADGGLGGVGLEYASVYWALAGFRAGIDAAKWLKKTDDAFHWQSQYDELLSSFRKAAARDIRRNASAHWYLPLRVADTSQNVPPQQASWPILEAQGFAHLFDLRDTLVTGTLSMLNDNTREGLPVGTGWLKEGLWSFFGSIEGIAHTYQRDYVAAQRLLYAVANHASPLGTWVEEQLPRDAGIRTSGDASNASASALFIKQVKRLLIMERGDTLELLAGIPSAWVAPGKSVVLKDCPVEGGKVSLSLVVDPGGRKASLAVNPVGKIGEPGFVLLDLRAIRESGFVREEGKLLPDALRIERGRPYTIALIRRPGEF